MTCLPRSSEARSARGSALLHCSLTQAALSTAPPGALRGSLRATTAGPRGSPAAPSSAFKHPGAVLSPLTMEALNPNAELLESRACTVLFTTIRESTTTQRDVSRHPSMNPATFSREIAVTQPVALRSGPARRSAQYVAASDRLMAILAEEGLARLNTVTPKTVTTPCGTYEGLAAPASETICGVDIVRSGGILLEAVRKIAPDSRHTRNFKRIGQDSSSLAFYDRFLPVRSGAAFHSADTRLVGWSRALDLGKTAKILIQRDEETALPKLFYSKLPPDIANLSVVLCDPMVRICFSQKLSQGYFGLFLSLASRSSLTYSCFVVAPLRCSLRPVVLPLPPSRCSKRPGSRRRTFSS